MRSRVGWILGVGCAWAAAVYWAFALTVLQPPSEPVKPWHENLASNNTYWVRDLRWTALLVVLVGLVLAFRGDRRRSLLTALGAVVWWRLDLWLDHADVTATIPVAAAATLVVLGAGLTARLGSVRPGRGVLLVTASVAAAAAAVIVGVESPSDSEAALNPSALGLGGLLLFAALGCALFAALALTRDRLLIAAAIGAAAAVGMVWARAVPPGQRVGPLLGLTVLLMTGVTLLALDWPAERRSWAFFALVPVGMLVGYPVLVMAAVMVSMTLAPTFTAMAGNAPVNSADTDLALTVVGAAAGLVVGLLLRQVQTVVRGLNLNTRA
jgi:hypothetical protein